MNPNAVGRPLLKQVWNTSRRIPLRKLLAIKEYPSDMQNVLTLYAEGYSLADFLVQAGGKTRYLEFLNTAHEHGWDRAIAEHYSLKDVEELETRWNDWVMAGSPQLKIPKGSQLASNTAETKNEPAKATAEFERPIIRAQSPENPQVAPEQRVASAPKASLPEAKPAVPLPKTPEIREESAGWRKMREQLQGIPADFVNPANDPTRVAGDSVSREPLPNIEPSTESNPRPEGTDAPDVVHESPSSPNGAKTSPPASNEPAFRFELDETTGSPGGQNSVNGRSPNWSDFPRNQANRDPARLENASERPFSP